MSSRRPGLNLIAKAIRKMNKSTKLIAAITLAALVGSASFIRSASFFSAVLIATIGGLLVFLGLWIEKESEVEEKNLSAFACAVRMSKLKSGIGWWVLMAGIMIEIADAAWTTNELWETRKIAIRSDPLDAPINSVSAMVKLKVKGVRQVPFNTDGQGVFSPPSEEEKPSWGMGGITFMEGTNVSKPIYSLSSGSSDIQVLGSGLVGGPQDWRGILVGFKENDFNSWNMIDRLPQTVSRQERWLENSMRLEALQ